MASTIYNLRQNLITKLRAVSNQAETDAAHLLCHVLDINTAYLYSHAEQEIDSENLQQIDLLSARLLNHEPLAYVLGEQEFYNLNFSVNPNVLIPRASTECLVDWVLDKYGKQKKLKVLDLGTGSGCIACSLASNCPDWDITALDISIDALTIAKKNAFELNCGQVKFLQSNWFMAVENEKFDLIITNPPYIASEDECFKEQSLSYEPKAALVSDDFGLADIKHIISTASNYLKPNAALILEHGNKQSKYIKEKLLEHNFKDVITCNDLANHERFTVARYF